jgi:hypothetical protein
MECNLRLIRHCNFSFSNFLSRRCSRDTRIVPLKRCRVREPGGQPPKLQRNDHADGRSVVMGELGESRSFCSMTIKCHSG